MLNASAFSLSALRRLSLYTSLTLLALTVQVNALPVAQAALETTSPQGDPIPPSQAVLKLNIEDALLMTLAHNRELKLQRFDLKLAQQALPAAEASFAPRITASA